MCTAFSTSTPASVSGIDKHWVNVSHKGWKKGLAPWHLAAGPQHGEFSVELRWQTVGKKALSCPPLLFMQHSAGGVTWVSGWFLHTAPQLLYTQIGKDSTASWALDISLKNNFCAFGLEARSPETLILALTMTWVTSAGKAFWDRPLEGLWCFVGCLNKMHNPDKCTVSEPRMGFGTGSTLNGDVA